MHTTLVHTSPKFCINVCVLLTAGWFDVTWCLERPGFTVTQPLEITVNFDRACRVYLYMSLLSHLTPCACDRCAHVCQVLCQFVRSCDGQRVISDIMLRNLVFAPAPKTLKLAQSLSMAVFLVTRPFEWCHCLFDLMRISPFWVVKFSFTYGSPKPDWAESGLNLG